MDSTEAPRSRRIARRPRSRGQGLRSPAPGPEKLLQARIVHDPIEQFGGRVNAERHGEAGVAVGVVGRPVQWIDEPTIPRVPLQSGAFFGYKTVAGKLMLNEGGDRLLRSAIDAGHEILVPFVFDDSRALQALSQDGPGLLGGPQRYISH